LTLQYAAMSTLHFIGGEKGGVGKSVVARAVVQRCIDKELPFAAFDADGSHGALLRHYKDFATPIDLTRFESSDEILSAATNAVSQVVVDLPAQSERFLGQWIDDADILGFAQDCGVNVVFWHVIDDGKDSITTLSRLIERYGETARFVVVKNLGRGKDFSLFDNSPVREMAEERNAKIIEIRSLFTPVMQKIDRFDASYWAAAYNKDYAPEAFTAIDRQRVRVWLSSVNREFDQVGLGL